MLFLYLVLILVLYINLECMCTCNPFIHVFVWQFYNQDLGYILGYLPGLNQKWQMFPQFYNLEKSTRVLCTRLSFDPFVIHRHYLVLGSMYLCNITSLNLMSPTRIQETFLCMVHKKFFKVSSLINEVLLKSVFFRVAKSFTQ